MFYGKYIFWGLWAHLVIPLKPTLEDRATLQVYITVKKVRRFYCKIPANQLPVHIPLFLRASACRAFLENQEIKGLC